MKGSLRRWNNDRGFGFIRCNERGEDIFAHISAFKKGYRRPKDGDTLTFELASSNGRLHADNISIDGVKPLSRNLSILKVVIPFLILFIFFVQGNRNFEDPINAVKHPQFRSTDTRKVDFTCQGKQYCREMSSCAEASFYLSNCPNMKIDGDHDGIPCEQQCG